MASKYANVHYDRTTYARWRAQLGPSLPRLMKALVDREKFHTNPWTHIYIEFQGNPDNFSENTILKPLCLRKPAEVPNILGRLLGKEEKPHGRLIILKAVTPNEVGFWDKLADMLLRLHKRITANWAKNTLA